MKKLDISELEKEKERINKEVDFILDEIAHLEHHLQESAFLNYEYLLKPYGLIRWGAMQEGEKSTRRLHFFHNDKYKPLIECPADVRWLVYHHLQDFIDNLVKNQKSRVRNENSKN